MVWWHHAANHYVNQCITRPEAIDIKRMIHDILTSLPNTTTVLCVHVLLDFTHTLRNWLHSYWLNHETIQGSMRKQQDILVVYQMDSFVIAYIAKTNLKLGSKSRSETKAQEPPHASISKFSGDGLVRELLTYGRRQTSANTAHLHYSSSLFEACHSRSHNWGSNRSAHSLSYLTAVHLKIMYP